MRRRVHVDFERWRVRWRHVHIVVLVVIVGEFVDLVEVIFLIEVTARLAIVQQVVVDAVLVVVVIW